MKWYDCQGCPFCDNGDKWCDYLFRHRSQVDKCPYQKVKKEWSRNARIKREAGL